MLGKPHPVPLCQVYVSSTSSPPRSRPCGTRLMTTNRTWIAPPFRTSTRSCRFLFWSTSTPDPPSLQPQRLPHKEKQHSNWTDFFLLMFHCSKDLELLFYRLTLYLMLFKHQAFKTLKLHLPFESPATRSAHRILCVCFTTLLSLYQPKTLLNTVMRHLSVNANVWCLKEKEHCRGKRKQ